MKLQLFFVSLVSEPFHLLFFVSYSNLTYSRFLNIVNHGEVKTIVTKNVKVLKQIFFVASTILSSCYHEAEHVFSEESAVYKPQPYKICKIHVLQQLSPYMTYKSAFRHFLAMCLPKKGDVLLSMDANGTAEGVKDMRSGYQKFSTFPVELALSEKIICIVYMVMQQNHGTCFFLFCLHSETLEYLKSL